MISNQQGWTIEPAYGGNWLVRNQHGQEIASGMSETDARRDAKKAAAKLGLPVQDLKRITLDWE